MRALGNGGRDLCIETDPHSNSIYELFIVKRLHEHAVCKVTKKASMQIATFQVKNIVDHKHWNSVFLGYRAEGCHGALLH